MKRRAILAAPLLMAAGPRAPLAATPISRMELPRWANRHIAKLAELRAGPVELLWIGDSITEDWEKSGPPAWRDFAPVWERFYGGRRAVNLGFSGDATSHLLWRLRNGQLDGISPKAAILLIGTNHFGRLRWSQQDTLAGIAACLEEIRKRLPRTKVLLLSVPPSDRGDWTAQAGREANRLLAARYGAGSVSNVTFIDTTPLYLRDGAIDRSQFYDPLFTPPEPALHPTAQAHARLAAAIEPTVAAMLGDAHRHFGDARRQFGDALPRR